MPRLTIIVLALVATASVFANAAPSGDGKHRLGATMAITTMADIEDASVSDNEANVSYYERAEDLFIIW